MNETAYVSELAPDRSKSSPAAISRGFVSWLIRHKVALVCSCGETGDLFFIGAASDGGAVFSRARFSRPMGIAAFPQRIFLAARTQIWRLENALAQGQIANERFDRVFAPRSTLITGDIDAHEIGVETSGRIMLANTAYSCLATASLTHAFKPVWKPKFISKLAPEDRCHLNGIGMEGGRARIVSVCSMTDIVDGWRDHRADGGAIIDIESDRVLAEGLSMPHSPRLYRGALLALDSGSGHLCRIDLQTAKREDVVFAPGFLRGLAFCGDYAVVTMSLPRAGRLEGLALGDNIARRGAKPWAGLLIVDLRHGSVVEWLRLDEAISQLFDVAVLPMMRAPTGVSPESAELQETITFEEASMTLEENGSVVAKEGAM